MIKAIQNFELLNQFLFTSIQRRGILVDDKGYIIKELEPLKIEEETEDIIKVVRLLKSH